MLYDLESGVNTAERNFPINRMLVLGEGAFFNRTTQNWLTRFRTGDQAVKDRPQPGAPSCLDDECSRYLAKEDPQQTAR